MHILDDQNYIARFDSQHALAVAAAEPDQLQFAADIQQPAVQAFQPKQIVVTGMGGSALAAGLAKSWLNLPLPFEIVRTYALPQYVGAESLVIVSSYSGNTEETLGALADAETRQAHIIVLTSGGKLLEAAKQKGYPYVQLPDNLQPRMAVFYNLKALLRIFEATLVFPNVDFKNKIDELSGAVAWLNTQVQQWTAAQPTDQNLAKQLAEKVVGKTVVIYAGPLMAPVAYKWKISFNENAKNLAFWNELPEFNHNEFIGWSSHPIEKPFAVFDLVSNFEHQRILKRFEVSDRLLSGLRPKAMRVDLQGATPLQQMLWGAVLADFVSIYTALLNGVNPTPVALIEKLKVALAKS